MEALHRLAAAAGRPRLDVVHMKTLPLGDPSAALAMAQEYANAGVTHLVHTQGVRDEVEFAAMVDVLCTKIQPAFPRSYSRGR